MTYIPYWYIMALKLLPTIFRKTPIIKLKKIRRLFILKNYQLYKVYSILNIKVLLYSQGDNKYSRASTGRQFSRLIYKPEQVVGGHIIVLREGIEHLRRKSPLVALISRIDRLRCVQYFGYIRLCQVVILTHCTDSLCQFHKKSPFFCVLSQAYHNIIWCY